MNLKNILRCLFFSTLICLSSVTSVKPVFTPIPITLQLAPVLAGSAILGPIGGSAACFIYIMLGALGLPVFAGATAGTAHLFDISGGFIMGFVPCAYVTGKTSRFFYQQDGRFFVQFASLFVSMALGTLILYFFGVIYFYILTGYTLSLSIVQSIMPFIWIDLLKIILSAYVSRQFLHFFDN